MSRLHRGNVLNMYRSLRGLTIKELAAILDCSHSVITQCQCGYRRGGPDFWLKFYKLTGISVKDIDEFIEKNQTENQNLIFQRIINS